MKAFLIALAALALAPAAYAANCAGYPYTLSNGQTADANQVMADFNLILGCANNNLAGAGANTSITSLGGLTTPLTLAQGGTGNTTGQPSGAAGNGLSGSYPNPSLAVVPAFSILGNDTATATAAFSLTAAQAATVVLPSIITTSSTWAAQSYPSGLTVEGGVGAYVGGTAGPGQIAYGAAAPGTLAVGQIYLQTN